MLIGVPKEVKDQEYRVGLTPESASELVAHGHQVIVETQAGIGIGCSDAAYTEVGARIVAVAEDIFTQAEMIVKVKEPQESESKRLRSGQILFTYLHLAPDYRLTRDLIESGAICVAYETVEDKSGGLPLLTPMSEVAGRLSIQAGAYCLERAHGGKGVLLGGVPGVRPARVVVIGGGSVGSNALLIALGMGADVTVLDRNLMVLTKIAERYSPAVKTVYSTRHSLRQHALQADLVIGAVLIPGAQAPRLITAEMVRQMESGSVLVDVAIDQGGCFETSRPTTHTHPTYSVDGIVHYCVTNMPGAVPQTSTYALNNATLPYILRLADKGWRQALLEDSGFLKGLNVCSGKVTYEAIAAIHGFDYHEPRGFL